MIPPRRPMPERFSQLPGSLARLARTVRLVGDIPALLIHPDWSSPAPCVVWLHGRTAFKELDPGRYQRWVRAGIAACAIDLPGHGERADEDLQTSARSLDVIGQAVGELDGIVGSLAEPALGGVFDMARLGIGGMSAGGMVVLRRLCDPHPFVAAAVEGTSGSLATLPSYQDRVDSPALRRLNPIDHVTTWKPIPLLALHSERDALVPVSGMREFLAELTRTYQAQGADPGLIRFTTWLETGAPQEHLGFGRVSNDAKNLQTEFYREHLRATPV